MSVKNKIITISGEPVTGKGTNVRAITEKLIDKGYKKENIHIITTGHEFRRYFEAIMEFIRNLGNDEALKALHEKEEIKTIFDNAEYRNKFTKELAKLKKLNKDFSKTLSIEQENNTPELAGVREIVDTLIDKNVSRMGMEINKKERKEEVWIVDSRLAFKNIPDSFKVRLTCRPDVAGKRLLGDNTRGKEDNQYKNLEDAINQREKRRIGEIERYKDIYGVDLSNPDNYNLIIDTSYSSIDDISDTILNCLELYQKDEDFSKRWASPMMFVPTQSIRNTGSQSFKGITIEDLKNKISKEGYDPNSPVTVGEVDDIMYLIDGHHRNFAAVKAKKTLIPYYRINDEKPELVNLFRSDLGRDTNILSNIYDHSDCIRRGFDYKEVYPDLYEKLKSYKNQQKERENI